MNHPQLFLRLRRVTLIPAFAALVALNGGFARTIPTGGPRARGIPPADIREIARTPITLSAKDADFVGLLHAVYDASPRRPDVQARSVRAYRATLAVRNMRTVDVLRAVAGLGGCNLYVLPDRFLIVPEAEIRADEKARAIAIDGPRDSGGAIRQGEGRR